MSYKQVPITAKILKTTKGGVTQPILNMGAAVGKMKAPSPAQKRSRSGYKTPTPSAPRAKASNPRVKNSRQDLATKRKELTTKKVEVAGNVKGKLKPGEGVLKSPKQEAKLTKKQESFIKDPTGGVTKPPKTKSTKITGKIGSDLRRQQYKDKGWADDATTMKPKVKAANTIKAKKGVDVKKARTTSLETKLDPKALKTQVAKVNSKKAEPSKGNVRKANRKLDSADRKDSRASRVSQKAKDARASGNTAKADRLDRRVGRIKKRANKKRGQAAGAIGVEKKTKKQSFNAVTDKAGYDAFQKAGGLTAWSKGKIKVK